MKLWKWFVGQVTRLRGSIAGVGAPDAERRGRADDHSDVADEPAAGPPAHWVERVRRGAPGLLEPPLRPGEPPGQPVAERVMPSQTQLEPQASPLERPERDYVPREPPVAPRRSDARAWPSLLRKLLLRERSVRAAEVDGSPASTADRIARELDAPTRPLGETAAPA